MSDRRIFFYEIEIASRSKKVLEPPTLEKILETFERRMKKGQQILSMRKGDLAVALGDLEIDRKKKIASALIRLGDKSLPDAVYSNLTDAGFRHIEKQNGEFGEVGAHFVMSLMPVNKKPHHYLAVMEGVRRLSHSLVRRLFSEILDKEYAENPNAFTYPDPCDGAKRHPHCPTLEFTGLLSDDLIDQLDNAKIREVSLIHKELQTPLGSAAFLKRKRLELQLSVDEGPIKNRWNKLKAALSGESQKFEQARIRFEREDHTPGTVYIDTQTGNAELNKYVKSVTLVDISPPLAESSKHLAPQLVKLMEEQVEKNR